MIYPRVGLRNADLSNACLRDIQLVSTDRKETVSLEGAILRGADLRGAILEGADLRGKQTRLPDYARCPRAWHNPIVDQKKEMEEMEEKET